jgi:hypothetical protein
MAGALPPAETVGNSTSPAFAGGSGAAVGSGLAMHARSGSTRTALAGFQPSPTMTVQGDPARMGVPAAATRRNTSEAETEPVVDGLFARCLRDL